MSRLTSSTIRLYIGLPRSGKSLSMTTDLCEEMAGGQRVLTNYPLAGAFELRSIAELHGEHMRLVRVGIQEAGNVLNARETMRTDTLVTSAAELAGHYGQRWYIDCQDPTQMDTRIRRVVSELVACRRWTGPKGTLAWLVARDGSERSYMGLRHHWWTHPFCIVNDYFDRACMDDNGNILGTPKPLKTEYRIWHLGVGKAAGRYDSLATVMSEEDRERLARLLPVLENRGGVRPWYEVTPEGKWVLLPRRVRVTEREILDLMEERARRSQGSRGLVL